MKERKLIHFFAYGSDKDGYPLICEITFAYYENGKWTGETEDLSLTVNELYNLIKPALEYNKY
jgi:hypothetical protein